MPAALTSYSMVAIRNDTTHSITFTVDITKPDGTSVLKRDFTVAARATQPLDWTSNVRPIFTIRYTSSTTGGHPSKRDTPVTSRSKDLAKPPTPSEVSQFGSVWKFTASGTGVYEVVTLQAERM